MTTRSAALITAVVLCLAITACDSPPLHKDAKGAPKTAPAPEEVHAMTSDLASSAAKAANAPSSDAAALEKIEVTGGRIDRAPAESEAVAPSKSPPKASTDSSIPTAEPPTIVDSTPVAVAPPGPVEQTAPVTPSTGATTTEKVAEPSSGIHWASWTWDRDPAEPSGDPLAIGHEYQLRLALVTFDLGHLHPAVESRKADTRVASDIESKSPEKLEYTVYVVPSDEGALFISDRERLKPLTVSRTLDQSPPSGSSEAHTPTFKEAVAAGLLGKVDILVKVLRPGRHEIGLVVLDSEGSPVDVYTATVCAQAPCTRIQSGSAPSLTAALTSPADAVLLLHEMSQQSEKGQLRYKVYAILFYSDSYLGRRFIAWNTGNDLDSIKDSVRSLRKAVADDNNGAVVAIRGLRTGMNIFYSEQGEFDSAKAAEGRNILSHLVLSSPTTPRLVVRVSSSHPSRLGLEQLPVIPFSMLGFQASQASEKIYLGERFILSVAMPRQSYGSTDCPDEWRIFMPPQMPDSDDESLERARHLSMQYLDAWLPLVLDESDMKNLSSWLGEPAVPSDARKSTLLAVLAHQDGGNLYYTHVGESIDAASAPRQFRKPSIAIIGACDVAGDSINKGSLIGHLLMTQDRMGAVVTTTTKISGELAAAYLGCVRSVVSKKPIMTVGEMHHAVTQCLWSPEKGKPWDSQRRYAHSALKYQLYGDPLQHVCSPGHRMDAGRPR